MDGVHTRASPEGGRRWPGPWMWTATPHPRAGCWRWTWTRGQHRLTLAPRPVGSGDARVGMMTRFRRHYPGGLVAELAVAWLGSAEAEALMDQVEAGFCVTRHWTGDEVGEWTPEAWAAAEALFVEVGERLDLQD